MPERESDRTVIRGGQVIDGTGADPRRADVLIVGDRIDAVGEIEPQPGDRTIDAADAFVTPGFINIHGHTDFAALAAPDAQSRVFDGVTTEVSGNCGYSVYPVRGETLAHILPDAERNRVEVDWTDFAGFAERIEGNGSAINHAYLVGHGALRAAGMGLDDRSPSSDEAKAMRAMLEEALEQGVFGLSSGLIYAPGCYADTAELADLAAVCTTADPPAIYASHQRSEGDDLEASLDEFLAVVRQGGVRGLLSHVKVAGKQNWHKLPWLRDQLQAARDSGLEVFGDRYPYTASSTGLSSVLPNWTQAGGNEAFLKRLADPDTRRRIAHDVQPDDPIDHWSRVVIAWSPADDHAPFCGRTVGEIAAETGRDPLDLVIDLLLETEGRVSAIYHRMDERNLEAILRLPFIAIGSDSRARSDVGQDRRGLPHPRGYGSHARVLGRYARERQVLTWPEAVRRMTGLSAEILGLADRGRLAPGCLADVVVFEPDAIRDAATFENPRQASIGIRHVLVNGTAVLSGGRHTGALPGRVLRRN